METLTLKGQSRVDARPAILRALPAAITAIAVAGGIGLRCINLGANSLWYDEGYTAWVISNPVGEVLRVIRVDTAPPLYYLLLRGWTHLFGRGEASLRSMSALMASIAVLMFVAIAHRLIKSPWGRTASIVLFSFSFMQIAYAHEARFYAMMTLLGAIDLYLVLLLCQRSTPLRLGALAVAWGVSLYTNNMMAVYLVCLGIGWLLIPGRRPIIGRVRDGAIVLVTVSLLYAPWVPTLLTQAKRLQDGFWPSIPDLWSLLRTIGVMAGVHEQSLARGDWHQFLGVDLLLGGLAALASGSRKGWRIVVALLSFGLVPMLVIFVYSQLRQSIFMERAFLASGIAMPLLVALPLDAARSRPARVVAIGGICWMIWLNLWSLPGRYTGEQFEDWRGASAYAAQTAEAHHGLLTIFVANEGELLYDYYQRGSDYSPRADLTGSPIDFFQLNPPQTLQRIRRDSELAQIQRLLSGGNYDEFVLICSHSWWGDHEQRTLALLNQRFAKTDERQFAQIRVYKFGLKR